MQQGAAMYGAPGYNSPFHGQQQHGGYVQPKSPPGHGAPPTPTPGGYGGTSSYGGSGAGAYRPSPGFAPPRQESMMGGDPYGQREHRLRGSTPLFALVLGGGPGGVDHRCRSFARHSPARALVWKCSLAQAHPTYIPVWAAPRCNCSARSRPQPGVPNLPSRPVPQIHGLPPLSSSSLRPPCPLPIPRADAGWSLDVLVSAV